MAATRARDKLAAERRRQPMTRIEKEYVFAGPKGPARLRDLFEGRRQLVLYHFMFAPGVSGWPNAGCDGCSMFVDQIGHPAHFHARDVSLAKTAICVVNTMDQPSIMRRCGDHRRAGRGYATDRTGPRNHRGVAGCRAYRGRFKSGGDLQRIENTGTG